MFESRLHSFFFYKQGKNLFQPRLCLILNNRPYCYKTIDLLFFSEHLSLDMLIAIMLLKKNECSSNLTHLCRCKIQEELLSECETIQSRMTNEKTKRLNTEETARRFANLMMQGIVNPAIRLLDKPP